MDLGSALFWGRVWYRLGFCGRPSNSHGHVTWKTGADQPSLSFHGDINPRGIGSRSHISGDMVSLVLLQQGTRGVLLWGATCNHKCMYMIYVYDSWSFYFTMIKFWSSCPTSCTSAESSFVRQVMSDFANHYICMSHHIWFCEPLNFHCNKFLLQKYFF